MIKSLRYWGVLVLLCLSASTIQAQSSDPGAICVNIDRQQIDLLAAQQQEAAANNEPAVEEESILPTAVLLIMDGSGSMNDAFEGGGKRIDAAKDVLREYVAALSENAQVGLRLLNGSCETRLLSSIGPLNRDGMLRAIDSITPDGSTPLAQAITAAGQDLKNIEGVREVVLVTDGQETCNGDPVKAASDLAQSDPDLNISIHVVGFSVLNDVPAQDNLRLIPRAGGGVFIPAETEEDLLQALTVTNRIPFLVYDLDGNILDDGLANRSSLPFEAGDYLIDIPAFGITQQAVSVINGRGAALNIAADGAVSVIEDALCIAEFCPEVPLPRLTVGQRGRVSLQDPRSSRVRNGPGTGATVLTQIEPGVEFDVLDGPVCSDGYLWYRIRTDTLEGWSAEGLPGNYFLEPFQ